MVIDARLIVLRQAYIGIHHAGSLILSLLGPVFQRQVRVTLQSDAVQLVFPSDELLRLCDSASADSGA